MPDDLKEKFSQALESGLVTPIVQQFKCQTDAVNTLVGKLGDQVKALEAAQARRHREMMFCLYAVLILLFVFGLVYACQSWLYQ